MDGKTSFFIPVYSQSTGERAPETIEKVLSLSEARDFGFSTSALLVHTGEGRLPKSIKYDFFLTFLVVALSPEKERWLLVAVATHLSGKYCTALKSRGPTA